MIALNETNEYAAEVPFTLPLTTDPLTGLTGWTFTLGEVKIKLPGAGAWINVAVNKIVEKGYGRFAARLTSVQTTTAGIVGIQVSVTGTQPFFGFETIGTLGGDIPVAGTGYVLFYFPDSVDPVYGTPISTADMTTSGTLRICLPNAAYRDCTAGEKASVINLGYGGYALPLNATLTALPGKVYLYADYPSAQRYEGYATILGTGVSIPVPPVPPTPIPVPTVISTSSVIGKADLVNQAVNRLCEYSKSGNFASGVFVDDIGA